MKKLSLIFSILILGTLPAIPQNQEIYFDKISENDWQKILEQKDLYLPADIHHNTIIVEPFDFEQYSCSIRKAYYKNCSSDNSIIFDCNNIAYNFSSILFKDPEYYLRFYQRKRKKDLRKLQRSIDNVFFTSQSDTLNPKEYPYILMYRGFTTKNCKDQSTWITGYVPYIYDRFANKEFKIIPGLKTIIDLISDLKEH